jgi:hypothetical protein
MTGSTERSPLVDELAKLRIAVGDHTAVLRSRERTPQPFPPPRPLAGPVAVYALAHGLLGQFDREVPKSYLRKDGLRCLCGERIVWDGRFLVDCACDRTFLRTSARVRVARLEAETAPEPCRCENRRTLYEGWDETVRCAHCDGLVAEQVAA